MSIAVVVVLALNYVLQGSYESMEMIKFVDASEDSTYEQDELYAGYIKSAKLQKDLMS